jgi:putative heme iron utilization protein
MNDPSDATTQEAATDARRWLLETASGTLGTLSASSETSGYPFLSVVPFALDGVGRPLFQLADIAVHSRNLKADERASLLIQQPSLAGDPQSGWRITVLGKVRPVLLKEREEAFARFVERVPRAVEYEKTHGFALYRLEVERVRYIGGFGRICWIPGALMLRDPQGAGLAVSAPEAVEHMNHDHAESLREMCEGLYGFKPKNATMLRLDRTGFFVQAKDPDRLCHFTFGREIDADSIRPAVIGVLKKARGQKPRDEVPKA